MTPLFWSRRGEVCCREHAPAPDSARWDDERWQPLPERGRRSSVYRCAQCAARVSAASPSGPDGRRLVILNVDDRLSNLYLRDRVMRTSGFVVVNATSSTEAIHALRQFRPALVLLAVHLGGADGRALCEHLKRDAEFAHVRVVLIAATVAGEAELFEAGRSRGFDGLIKEPVAPDVLISTIRAVLGGGARAGANA